MPTIRDVAALAGVSYTTVSHVVNDTRPVRADKRERVLAAVAELHFVPSAVARSLKAQATRTIGMLVPSNTNPYFAEIAQGVENLARRHGYCVFLCNSDNDVEVQREWLRVLHEKRVDGLIIASVGDEAAAAEALRHVTVPVVVIDRPIAGIRADRVQVDHRAGAAIATRHLIDIGHRRIACIAGPDSTTVSAHRVDGFRLAMTEHGLPLPDESIVVADFTSPGGYNAAVALFRDYAPTAIFASNDAMAIGVLRAAAERGIRIPEDCSIVGFDDIEMSRYVYPALSTVGQTIGRLGEVAAIGLLDRITGRVTGEVQHHMLVPRLLVRESTTAPRRATRARVAAKPAPSQKS
ncbi:LacI family DNA-binding transcriptional regulator [Robbsia andropogonis]|uniref:LacI family DNA-binding transcriptional regulator n=1 Tax=Robbsia andropogonis TaxID=28092 RepID=UPI000465E988|nr:LacI family DNA-binding transcriptional regulator [Robbsia andropogonis]